MRACTRPLFENSEVPRTADCYVEATNELIARSRSGLRNRFTVPVLDLSARMSAGICTPATG